MINLRSQQVNVNRRVLIEAIRSGLVLHRAQYTEALADYKLAVEVYLSKALKRVEEGNFDDVVLKLRPPVNKEQEYLDVIDILSVSVDDTIQLDKESYKAFYKNEWSWSSEFQTMAASYKSLI